MKLSPRLLRIFRRVHRKYNVSIEFLKSNIVDIRQFIMNAVRPHLLIKTQLVRKSLAGGEVGQRIILKYHHPQRFPLHLGKRKIMIKRQKRNMQQWSKRMVMYLRSQNVMRDFVTDLSDDERSAEHPTPHMAPEELSKQLKEQLELLRSGKRTATLIEGAIFNAAAKEQHGAQSCDTAKEPSTDVATEPQPENAKIVELPEGTDQLITAESEAVMLPTNPLQANQNDIMHIAAGPEDADRSQENMEKTPEKQIVVGSTNGFLDNLFQRSNYKHIDEKTEEENGACFAPVATASNGVPKAAEGPVKSNSNFLDMLMNKVRLRKLSTENKEEPCRRAEIAPYKQPPSSQQNDTADFTDSSEEFLGFEETERVPGMLMTPLVPYSEKKPETEKNSAFESESLNQYMRENLLESSVNKREPQEERVRRLHRQANCDGLLTSSATPPNMSMPAVPESLQRLRTVAERRQFLQKFSKNHKLSIINNEATIYRELQRKIRQQKVKSTPLQMLQAPGSQMPFTRQGWQAASFVGTDYNKYFYQELQVDGSADCIKLPGVSGNNEYKMKKPYFSRVAKSKDFNDSQSICPKGCVDVLTWRDFKAVKNQPNKAILNKNPFRPVFPPCPLSQKPFQKPLDDETAALLLAGSSMAVVPMPIVELDVVPEVGRPLPGVAKRYLEYILPHQHISREWAEFSVSTVQSPSQRTVKPAKMAAAAAAKATDGNGRRKWFTFVIPYLNDRSHILVRRVVDRSEQLDRSFKETRETSTGMADLSFRANIPPNDSLLQQCADVLSDMITSVAISCSENSFIKDDPDNDYANHAKGTSIFDEVAKSLSKAKKLDEASKKNSAGNAIVATQAPTTKKQKSLLLELRRLNATIIDAATKPEKAAEPCRKDYCALGCICPSLSDEYPLRQHCGKAKCIIECHCKVAKNAHIMRLQTDGRSITTEDAFLLRRKATARLARMEKEFTSTIVLTGNETLLINESQYDKKRRCTKAPKRYDDFTDADDDVYQTSMPSPKKSGAMVAFETPTNTSSDDHASAYATNAQVELTTELREPIYIKENVLSELKHCTVQLTRLEETHNIAAWCMVHELYKCFCGGRATEGKPLVIEKEDVNSRNAAANDEAAYRVPAPKARYSFEKLEAEAAHPYAGSQKAADTSNSQYIDSEDSNAEENEVISSSDDDDDDDDDDYALCVHSTKRDPAFNPFPKRPRQPAKVERRGRPMEGTIIRDYLNAKLNWCRRIVAVPTKTYTRRNRKRAAEVRESIKKNESPKTQLTLNEHILRSVYYHKHEFEKSLKAAKEKEQQAKLNKSTSPDKGKPQLVKHQPAAAAPVVEEVNDDDDVQFVDDSSLPATVVSVTTSMAQRMRESRKRHKTQLLQNNLSERQEISPDTKKPKLSSIISSTEIVLDSPPEEPPKPRVSGKSASVCQEAVGAPSNSLLINSQPPSAFSPVIKSSLTSAQLPKVATVKATSLLNSAKMPTASAVKTVSLLTSPRFPAASSLKTTPLFTAVKIPVTSVAAAPSLLTSVQFPAASQPTTASLFTSAQLPAPGDEMAAERATVSEIGFVDGAVATENFKEFYNVVIKNMNNLVSKKMQDIDMALKRESKVIPPPNEEILCIIKWSNFLDAFHEGYVFIWQVQMEKEKGPFFAATITNLMPMIVGAVGVVNIVALKSQQLPLVGRMLMNRVRNEQTRKLAMVMQGRSKYWLVKGFLYPDSAKACAKPTPQTHPALTRKINVLCSLLVKQRVKEHQRQVESQKEQPPGANPHSDEVECLGNRSAMAPQILPALTPFIPVPISELPAQNELPSMPLTVTLTTAEQMEEESTVPSTNYDLFTKKQTSPRPPSAISTATLVRSLIAQKEFANAKSNVEIRRVTEEDIAEIHHPGFLQEDHRWLILDLYNDFSHILVEEYNEIVSMDRLQKVIAYARQENKLVKLKFFQKAPFYAFAAPSEKRNIYFGPLKFNMRPPQLLLIQSVDRKLMLREVFEQEHKLQPDSKQRTTAFWMLQINGQIQFEMEPNTDAESAAAAVGNVIQQPTAAAAAVDSDDDCVIVENESEQAQNTAAVVPVAAAPATCSIIGNSIGNSLAVSGFSQIATAEGIQAAASEELAPLRVNFTIQALDNTNKLQIIPKAALEMSQQQQQLVQDALLPAANALLPLEAPLTTATTTQGIPGFVPLPVVITNVSAAPREAPYASTIYVSKVAEVAPNAPEAPLATSEPVEGGDTSSLPTAAPLATELEPSNEVLQPTPTTDCTIPKSTLPDADSIAAAAAAPLKRRRMSLRCPIVTDKETQDIAIDAAIKMLPESADSPKETRYQLQQPGTASHLQITRTITQDDDTELLSAITMLRPNTTITKISDKTLNLTPPQNAPKSSGVKFVEPPTKLRFLLPKAKNKNAVRKAAAAAAPIVFDVNFIDGSDEPAASIVIKPTISATPSTPSLASAFRTALSAVPSEIPTSNSNSNATPATNVPENNLSTTNVPTTAQNAAQNEETTVNAQKVRLIKRQRILYPQTIAKTANAPLPSSVVINGAGVGINPSTNTNQKSSSNTNYSANFIPPAPSPIITANAILNNGCLPTSIVTSQTKKNTTVKTTFIDNPRTARLSLPTLNSAKSPASVSQAPKRTATTSLSPPQRVSVAATRSDQVNTPAKRARLSLPNTLPSPESVANKNSQNSKQPDTRYGYIVANVAGLPRFAVKRIDNEFLIKLPNFQGILKLNGMANVSTYLSKHILKTAHSKNLLKKLPTSWTFVPQDRINPQRHKVLPTANIPAQQNANSQCHLQPVTCPCSSVAAAAAANLGNPSVSSTQEPCDTILIED